MKIAGVGAIPIFKLNRGRREFVYSKFLVSGHTSYFIVLGFFSDKLF